MVKLILFFIILLSFCNAYSQQDTINDKLIRFDQSRRVYYFGELSAYPNPFSPHFTKIKFGLADSCSVNLLLLSKEGDTLKTLFNLILPQGEYVYSPDTDTVGIFIYDFNVINLRKTQKFWTSKKMVILK